MAASLQPIPELAEVLDDPVVDDGDLARAVLVRMGVQIVRPAMGRPAGMGQADGGMRRAVRDGRLQICELAGALLDEQVAGVVDERDTSGVVPAVFEALQAFDEDGACLPGTGVPDDATHGVCLRSCPTASADRSS